MPYATQDAASDADDEYERVGIASPEQTVKYDPLSPTHSETPSNEDTPRDFVHPKPPHSLPAGIITTWGPDDCANFLSTLGLEQYGAAAVDESVDGEALVAMQHSDLKDMGVRSAGHRLTILKAVYETKIRHNIPIEDEHYVPPSADVEVPEVYATREDLTQILDEIRIRDQRIQVDLRQMKDDLNRVSDEQRKLREETLPVIRMAKDRLQPLPTPDAQLHDPISLPQPPLQPAPPEHKLGSSLSRKFSTKKLFLGSASVNPWPPIRETGGMVNDSSTGTATVTSHLAAPQIPTPQLSPGVYSAQNSPTSPPPFSSTLHPAASRSTINTGMTRGEQYWSQASTLIPDRTSATPASASAVAPRRDPPDPPTSATATPALTPSSATVPTANPSGELLKSFRISGDAPCHKVLPAALIKYGVKDDPSQYSLYIVFGDQERCLGPDERPLMLFKHLQREGRSPMFMLRKHAPPRVGFVTAKSQGALDGSGRRGAGWGAMMDMDGEIYDNRCAPLMPRFECL